MSDNGERQATGRPFGSTRTRIALAAVMVLAIAVAAVAIFGRDVVHAMGRAVAGVESFHGVIEVRSQCATGESWLVRRVEVWSAGQRYATSQQDGTVTVNDGKRKWQVSHDRREVILLPAAPDPARRGLDLREEAARAAGYPHRVVGKELVAGRQASKVEVTPPGGLPYYLWIDSRTHLPVKLRTAMYDGMCTEYEFVSFTPNAAVDPAAFAYLPPSSYAVISENPQQLVASVEEAREVSGVNPLLPAEPPAKILAAAGSIALDYGDIVVVQTDVGAGGGFRPAPGAGLGQAAGGPLEVLVDRLRWRQGALEVLVEGPRQSAVALARELAPDLTLPQDRRDPAATANVLVDVDLDEARRSQQQVDGGHSPWQLDPVYVAMVFVNMQVSPDGIQGEPVIPQTEFRLTDSDGVAAVVAVADGPISRVYLKRLVRQDDTGIWSVVGYDLSCPT